jgi:P2-related tail formation protein
MKKKKNIVIYIILGISLLISIPIVSVKLLSVYFNTNIKLWSRDIINNITKKQVLDVVWDFAQVEKADKTGYDLWVIGQEEGEIGSAMIATGETVKLVTYDKNELNMDYKSMEDYDKNNGAEAFRKFIENIK